jgi:hypothetical protein
MGVAKTVGREGNEVGLDGTSMLSLPGSLNSS